MNLRKINWKTVCDMLHVPFIFFVCYLASEAGCIAAILLGAEVPMSLLKIGWVIGLLCGCPVVHFVAVRPKNKMLDDYAIMTGEMLRMLSTQEQQLERFRNHPRLRRIEGDEWKDQD